MIAPTEHSCCFTGHREIPLCDEQKIMTRARYHIQRLILEERVTTFLAGGELGFDMLAAEAIIRRKREDPRLRLILILPFRGYEDCRTREQKDRLLHIRLNSSEILYASETPGKEACLLRNRMLADRADFCVSYCTRDRGAAADTIRYALSRNIPVFNASIWDVSRLKPCGRYAVRRHL